MSPAPKTGFHAEVGDDRASLRGQDFGVRFRRLGDHWSDLILVPGETDELASSHLVPPTSDDPSRVLNPVYQEVHLHRPEGGPNTCLLLTGRSFDHHFSAAVTLSTDPLQTARMILDFDVADRCRSPVQILAATYLVSLHSGALVDAAPDRVVWQVPGPTAGRLELLALSSASLSLAEAGRKAARVQILASIQPGTYTHRLRYRWCWTSAEGLTL
jgi:hypothetical protein